MKLQLISGELDTQEEKDIIRMLKRKGTFDFGLNRTYKHVGVNGAEMEIRIEDTLAVGSDRFRSVDVKPIY